MYRRIESHGRAICELTAETEITEPVQQIMALVALDGDDVPRVLASFDDAATKLESSARSCGCSRQFKVPASPGYRARLSETH